MRYGYIYKITNKLDGTVYIGQRHKEVLDEKYWGSGTHLLRALKKYGKENFKRDVIDWAYTKEELNEKEMFWIAFARNHYERCYNITAGGEGHKAHLTEEHKQRIRQIRTGSSKSAASKEKNRQASLKMWQDPAHRLKWDHTAWNKGLHGMYTDDVIKSNSDKHKKLWQDPEYRKKIEDGRKKAHQRTRAKKILAINYDLGQIILFNSGASCRDYFNFSAKYVVKPDGKLHISGKLKGWVLKRLED